MTDPLDNGKENEKREELVKRRKDRDRSDLLKVIGTSEGRRFLWRIMSEGRCFHSCFDLNPIQMAKNEGKRDVGLFILSDILKASPDTFVQMQKEAAKDKLLNAQELKRAIEE